MNSFTFTWLIVCLLVRMVLALTNKTPSTGITDIKPANVIVSFSPYVSILDVIRMPIYSVDDIVPLISKVATRFAKVFIRITTMELKGELSSGISTLAVAKYNCLKSTRTKIELILGVIMVNPCDCEEFEDSIPRATQLADKINAICSETISIILWFSGPTECRSVFRYCQETPNPPERYKYGELIGSREFCELGNVSLKGIHPSVLALGFDRSHDLFYKNLTECPLYELYRFRETEFLKYFSISDTELDSKINVKRLVKLWHKTFNDTANTYILERAFDTYILGTSTSTTGWWYLKEDPGTGNTSEYIFEEKSKIAETFDHEENPVNYHWLYEKHNFSSSSSGIIVNSILEYRTIRNDFCKFILKDAISEVESILEKVYDHATRCGSNFKLVLLNETLSFKAWSFIDVLVRNKVPVLILFKPENFNLAFNNIKRDYLDPVKSKGLTYGYLMPIELCHLHDYYSNVSRDYIAKILGDFDSDINVFYYQEPELKIDLGATRLFRFRKVLFEKCRKVVSKFGDRENKNSIGFLFTGYPKVGTSYDSPLKIQNYVKYMYLLNDWALRNTHTVIFMGNAVDGTVDFLSQVKYEAVGWYSFNQNTMKFETKQQQALRISVIAYSNTSLISPPSSQFELSSNQAVLFLSVSLVLILLGVLIGMLVYQQYYQKRLTSNEIQKFFSGTSSKSNTQGFDEQSEPYDKARYEIPTDKFKIDEDAMLGSGEFGKVCRGNVLIDGQVDVAVKYSNPYKLNNVTLKGFLSEIKVMGYLGQHKNIIQFIGANTASLKDGKVFIFLELCHLGSLEKFLRETCPLENAAVNVTLPKSFTNEKNYLNFCENASSSLDQSLSQDLYRWSTDICNGMAYLAEKQVVHADLATRNVLISLRREAKICDFGLSRRLYNYSQYVKTQQEPLPWKWMAPEALRLNTFDEKTDVWAYGVTLWEIYSLGSLPFGGVAWDSNFAAMLEGGLRMKRPQYEEKQMYTLMQKCWNTVADQRPKFSEILIQLTKPSAEEDEDQK